MNCITDMKRVMNVYDFRVPAVANGSSIHGLSRDWTTTREHCIFGMLLDRGMAQTYIFAFCLSSLMLKLLNMINEIKYRNFFVQKHEVDRTMF